MSAIVWIWFVGPPRLHVLKFSSHCEILRVELNLTWCLVVFGWEVVRIR
jgi:hypothetical protein